MRSGLLFSALLHLGLAALVALASWQRQKPSEPLPPPAYEVAYYEAGAPDRPAEEPSDPATPPAAPPEPVEAQPAPQEPPQPEVAERPAPPEPIAQAPPPPPQPLPAEEARVAEADPAPAVEEPLPAPPPAAPAAPPQREAALVSPPRPARPPPPERLPGLFLPDARLNPAPLRPEPPRRGLDLSPPSAMRQPGRDSPEAQLSIRGARVGPDWRNAFRRWIDDHVRYPMNAAVVGDEGTATIEMLVAPDGRVLSWRLVRQSGSVWLDHGTVSPFRNAVLPPFPPDADPNGVVVNLTIQWVLRR